MKCYQSDNPASDLEDEKQLNKTHREKERERASNKRKRKGNKRNDKKKQFWNVPLFRRRIETFIKSNEG